MLYCKGCHAISHRHNSAPHKTILLGSTCQLCSHEHATTYSFGLGKSFCGVCSDHILAKKDSSTFNMNSMPLPQPPTLTPTGSSTNLQSAQCDLCSNPGSELHTTMFCLGCAYPPWPKNVSESNPAFAARVAKSCNEPAIERDTANGATLIELMYCDFNPLTLSLCERMVLNPIINSPVKRGPRLLAKELEKALNSFATTLTSKTPPTNAKWVCSSTGVGGAASAIGPETIRRQERDQQLLFDLTGVEDNAFDDEETDDSQVVYYVFKEKKTGNDRIGYSVAPKAFATSADGCNLLRGWIRALLDQSRHIDPKNSVFGTVYFGSKRSTKKQSVFVLFEQWMSRKRYPTELGLVVAQYGTKCRLTAFDGQGVTCLDKTAANVPKCLEGLAASAGTFQPTAVDADLLAVFGIPATAADTGSGASSGSPSTPYRNDNVSLAWSPAADTSATLTSVIPHDGESAKALLIIRWSMQLHLF